MGFSFRALAPQVVVSVVLFLFHITPSLAAAADILITEIMYDYPGSDSDHEWVEIYNSGSGAVTLVGGSSSGAWRFYDGSNHLLSKTAFQGSMTLKSGEYAVIAENGPAFILDYPDYAGTIIECSAMSLKNSSETVGLRINSSGTLWSDFTYESSWGGAGNGKTIEKKGILGVNDSSNWVESSAEGGSPGEAYALPSYPAEISLSEYLPHPSAGNEWVELYNNADESVALTDWQIDDIEGGSSPKTFTVTMAARGYATVDLGTSFLNNGGDSLRLFQPDGSLIEETSFTFSYEGNSFAKDAAGVWRETTTLTPGEANVVSSPIHAGTVAELKNLAIGSRVSLEAYITAPPDLLGDDDFYVQDSSGGVKVSCSCSLEKTSFNLGDKVAISSTMEEARSERYIKTDAVTVLETGLSQVEAEEIQTGEVVEPREGKLVKIEGVVESVSGGTFYVDDGTGRAKVYIKDSAGIVRPKIRKGYRAKVIGLVSQYGYLGNGSANYRLLPRYQGDLEVYEPSLAEDEEKAEVLGSGGTAGEGGSVVEGSVLGAVTELPRTGGRDDLAKVGWILFFLGLDFRIICRLLRSTGSFNERGVL